ncbi:MAG: tRNA preQ1(34) S-adenosylmethionine ribosyltransferase-isomerase QueA [Candidatus Omnitrophica bacterium]|nr:tRNA preQ1(34) S-adenosylmethionine ribosyltransferase-isomerase QueA [Candidatus Omnitrophota bacterium]
MKLTEFDYELPRELIAQYPAGERDKCRLMVLDRSARTIVQRTFADIVEYFKKGDCLVLNNTKVIPARLFAKRKTGGKVEIFLLEKKDPISEVLLRPSLRVKEGEKIVLESGDEVEVMGRGNIGRFVKFSRPLDHILNEVGHVPLPPYISRRDELRDKNDYQTVYGVKEGATASPTAGLHFTDNILERIRAKGVKIVFVTLHTNYGTFRPIKCEDIEGHKMHEEYFELSQETADAVRRTKENGGAVFAVGTTTNRVLEHCRDSLKACSGHTDLFIYPGYKFKVVDHLITNFHLPCSTLLILASAFSGKEFIMEAYRKAIEEKYRFFSYGDATLIL